MEGSSSGFRRRGTRLVLALNVIALLAVLLGEPVAFSATPASSARGPTSSTSTIAGGATTARGAGSAKKHPAPTAVPTTAPTAVPTPVPTAAPTPTPTSTAPSRFVVACGTALCLGGRPWYLYGASDLGGLDDPSGRTSLAVAARLNTLRVVDFLDEHGSVATAPFDAARWARVDAAIAAAGRGGLHVVLDLSAYRNLLGNAGLNPYTYDWGPFVAFVTQRSNTVTGVRYADDPTIALVAFAGEVEPLNTPANVLGITTQEVTSFFGRTMDQWRAVDAHHLLSSGGLLQLDWDSGIDWRAIFGLANDRVCSIHDYSAADQTVTTPAVAAYCATLGKPWITEEFGWDQATGDATRATAFSAMYGLQLRYSAAGVAFWNLGTQVSGTDGVGDTHDVNPSTPLTWTAVQANAP